MVRYFLTDLRGNPVYSFAQRFTRRVPNRLNQRLSFQLQQQMMQQQRTTSTNQSSFYTTLLVCLIRNSDWENVVKRAQTHPQELCVIDVTTGNTVLHLACRLNPPAYVLQVLAIPSLARQPNHEGATPLHMAASHRCSKEALQVLLNAASHAEEEGDNVDSGIITSPTADLSRMGRAPIHYACMSFRGLDMEAFQLLLDATLKDGNLWVYETDNSNHSNNNNRNNNDLDEDDLLSSFVPEDDHEDDDEDEDAEHQDDENNNNDHKSYLNNISFTDIRSQKSQNENIVDAIFDNEFEGHLDRDLYQQIDDLTIGSSSSHHVHQQSQHLGVFSDINSITDFSNHNTVRVLVNVMGMKDATGQTPLGLLFRRYRERVRCVITTVDRLRQQHEENPDRAALVAAIRVHADLGELWEKARFIVARLTEERLQRENDIDDNSDNKNKKKEQQNKNENCPSNQRIKYYGGSFYQHQKGKNAAFAACPPSPGEAAVAQEAASWAVEQQHQKLKHQQKEKLAIPLASTISVHQFRIVHASVGLTGYGCPPELIRLAISIHPHQINEFDENGNLPLHIAVSAASYLAQHHADTSMTTMYNDPAVGDDHSVISALSFFSSATVSQTTNPFDKVIKILLQQYPDAARMPQGKTGKLPLVLAIESRRRTWADGIRTLLNAYPPALHNKKIIEPYAYPNVLALVASSVASDNNNHNINIPKFTSNNSNNNNSDMKRIVDILPVVGETVSNNNQSYTNNHNNNIVNTHSYVNSNNNNNNTFIRSGTGKRSKRAIRQEACSRTTLFELLRTKPEWITRGYVDNK